MIYINTIHTIRLKTQKMFANNPKRWFWSQIT